MTIAETEEGNHRGLRWKLRRKASDELTERYGDFTLSVLDGNHSIYTEAHHSSETTVSELSERAIDIINRIHDDENIARCDCCGELYNRHVGNYVYERELSWSDRHIYKHGMNPRYLSSSAEGRSETCVWTTGRIFDTLHVVTHHWEVNPFFDDAELVAVDSLVSCRGFERVEPDGEVRPYAEIEDKHQEINRKQARQSTREKRDGMLELLDWVLKREDRFPTDERFKPPHQR